MFADAEPLNRTPPPPDAGMDGLVWLIKELVDTGPTNWYRYRVQGEIWDQGTFVGELSWHVPDVDDPYFCVPPGRPFDAARAALAKAREEDRDMKKIELRLYEHPDTRATAYDAEGFAIDAEVAAHGWDYSAGDTVLIGGDSYTITQVYAIQTDDTRATTSAPLRRSRPQGPGGPHRPAPWHPATARRCEDAACAGGQRGRIGT